MEILYVSSVPSPEEFDRIKGTVRPGVNVTTYGMNESGFKFHTLIMNGICSDPENHVTSLVGRSVGRSTHQGFFWKGSECVARENLTYKHLGFLNFPVLKQLGIGFSMFFRTLSWCRKHRKEQKAMIMDASYVTVLPFVVCAAKLGKCKTTAIFCDIYDYMADVKDAFEKEKVSLLRRMMRKISTSCYHALDTYVFLTEQMNPLLNVKNKPYIVMEGLVDVNMEQMPNRPEDKAEKKVVMYAGALREAYGLKNLAEGFSTYPDDSAELWIFGDGDYKDGIRGYTESDPRIKFFGAVPLAEVIQKELQATLLVNPRPVGHQFTQYSFPSKNMEYMVSGTPILTTRLPGMPQEYYGYIFTIDGDGPEHITEALKKAFSHSREVLHEKGLEARDFVLKNKNNVAQVLRILKLLGYSRKDF